MEERHLIEIRVRTISGIAAHTNNVTSNRASIWLADYYLVLGTVSDAVYSMIAARAISYFRVKPDPLTMFKRPSSGGGMIFID